MKVENKPDGWHLVGDSGEHYGPFATLLELEDLLDLLENRAALKADAPPQKPPPHADGDGPVAKFV
jgi:hypothetical protein